MLLKTLSYVSNVGFKGSRVGGQVNASAGPLKELKNIKIIGEIMKMENIIVTK